MPVVTPGKLVALQRSPDNIRNDHGKTSLTDALLATNGIISPKMAGKIRYLDSRPDEQTRGITMESSAISLYFSMLRRTAADTTSEQNQYLINLIDSPGHIDFSSEVSTASRLCDGAVVLIDAVEGVCSQTVTVLRHTWIEHLKPLLVINKMDRLVTELKMTPGEAYFHLQKLLEQVNAVLGSFYQGERMEKDLHWREKVDERIAIAADRQRSQPNKESNFTDSESLNATADIANDQFEEKDDEGLYFAPEKHNVIFSSAVDGWAFTIRQFARMYEKKLGMKRISLERVLWGDFYLDPKTKKVLGRKHLKGRALKPMFVQLVLEQIWAVYQATSGGEKGKGDPALTEKITRSLDITIPPHVLRSRDPRSIQWTLFAAWIPLSTALLVSVVESLPSPITAQKQRLPGLLDKTRAAAYIDPSIRQAMIDFKHTKDDPVVVYVSKMVSVLESELPENKRRSGTSSPVEAREIGRRRRLEIGRAVMEGEKFADSIDGLSEAVGNTAIHGQAVREESSEREHLIGFARIYSGTLSVGDSVYVISPKYDPVYPHNGHKPQQVVVTALYLMMGRALEPLKSVPAGVVFGIGGLEGHIHKAGTICSQLEGCVNLAGVSMGSQAIVRVALEPEHPADLETMIHGLDLLVQSDPCAQYEHFESGEYVLLTAGELHLERCLTDLRERYARCELQASEPIVPYRETIVKVEDMKLPTNKDLGRGRVIISTTSKQSMVKLCVRPLPVEIVQFLDQNANIIRQFYSDRHSEEQVTEAENEERPRQQGDASEETFTDDTKIVSAEDLKQRLKEVISKIKSQREIWSNTVEQIAAIGPRQTGCNLLIDRTENNVCGRVLQDAKAGERQPHMRGLQAQDFADKIRYAFHLATANGPLCHEPVHGIAVFLEEVKVNPPNDETTGLDQIARLTGEVIKTVQQAIKQGFLDWSPRLLLAMYSCEIQASAEVLGRVYDVLTRRRGRILSESLREGTPFYTILSLLPVAESFGFSDEIRKRTSGAASPQLIFQGFEILDEDPFWTPFTNDDLEDLGELADKANLAKQYMDAVRTRKGLLVEGRKLVKDAEKQKTLKR